MQRDESRTDLGTIRIHKNVIASIASLAAADIQGVKRVGSRFAGTILDFIGNKASSGIRVEINKNEEVKVEIPLIIKYGFNIPDI
ncbi:MAG TPA: Asp23/Gls24 family envelope stress response protein, partial [Candidatus Margulisiibacteriota bacterium]|nr:Asp23/Gls24 family envelope stress response protein [Candidatus Margulisiibacteriota bacterium]